MIAPGTAGGRGPQDDGESERRIEELESELARANRELWGLRDALIGAQAEHATLKVRYRNLEVQTAQLQQLLDQQDTLHRLVGRLRSDERLRLAARKLRGLVGRG